jgi:catechol 2,3-dioxygenase-like lactoylglutathione lyase family enzyme
MIDDLSAFVSVRYMVDDVDAAIDGTLPEPGAWNRLHLIVDDSAAEVDRLRAAGAPFRNDGVVGPGGQQILLEGPSGNVVELFQPAAG